MSDAHFTQNVMSGDASDILADIQCVDLQYVDLQNVELQNVIQGVESHMILFGMLFVKQT